MKPKKIEMKKIADFIVEFADDNGFDVEVSSGKLVVFMNGTTKAFATVSLFIRAMFHGRAFHTAMKEWKLTFDRAMHVLWQGDGGTQFHAA